MLKNMVFCHLLHHLEIDMVKKIINTATKTGIDAAKTTSERVVEKTAEETGNLIGNKIADEITSAGKTKSIEKEKEDETNEIQEISIPPEKRQQIIDDLISS